MQARQGGPCQVLDHRPDRLGEQHFQHVEGQADRGGDNDDQQQQRAIFAGGVGKMTPEPGRGGRGLAGPVLRRNTGV